MTPSDEVSRLRRELEIAFDVAREIGEERNELAAALGREVAMTQRLRAALVVADELIDDLMGYATQAWDYKYGDYWREEQAKVKAARASDNGGGSDGTR